MTTRAEQIKDKLALLQAELEDLAPHERMTSRELSRQAGVAPTTASRFKAGEVGDMQLSTLSKLMPFARHCPLCGQDSEPEARGEASTDPLAAPTSQQPVTDGDV